MAQRKKKRSTTVPAVSAGVSTKLADPWRTIAGLSLLFGLALLVYLPSMNGGFLWDDDGYVTRHELRSLSGLYRIWFDVGATEQYYPLLHSAFWLEYKAWGENPLGYHLVNVLLHAASACLVWRILSRLKIPGAYLAAAIFVLHPVYVESVAWITELKNTLSGVFYFGAMLVYLRFDDDRRPSFYLLASLLFACGLLSKTVVVTLPAALLVIFWWQRGRLSWRNDVLPLIPWFAIAMLAGQFTAWFEKNLIGADGPDFQLTVLQRFLIAGRVFWFYLGKLVWPEDLLFSYPRWNVDATIWWQWLFPIGAIALVIGLWCVRHRWRGPLAGVLFFAGTLFPVLGFFDVFFFIFSFVADHFQYLASLGIVTLCAAGISVAIKQLSRDARLPAYGLCGILLLALAALTWRQNGTYRDLDTLYRITLEKNPNSWLVCNNLGKLLADQGEPQEAIALYQRALRLRSKYPEAHNNLALALAQSGQTKQAILEYELALQARPDYPEAHNNLALALSKIDREKAKTHYERAIELRPKYADAHNNLGILLAEMGLSAEAIERHQEAIRLNPDRADYYLMLGNARMQTEDFAGAIECYRHAIALNPDYSSAHNNLAIALVNAGDQQTAIPHFQKAVRLDPSNADAHYNLANILKSQGEYSLAIAHFQEALRQKPDFLVAMDDLTQTYAETGNYPAAIAAAEATLQLAHTQKNEKLVDQLERRLVSYRASQAKIRDESEKVRKGVGKAP